MAVIAVGLAIGAILVVLLAIGALTRTEVAPPPPEADLAVVPGDLPNACDGWAVAEGAVGASLVVVADPVWQ
jgi:hypothetical protein